ncbi:MAG: hypothetical protein EXR89_01500 [Methylococcaceae bacterium]|nr:hypothetical protein [Methylococcaceae bacterium]
MKKRCITRTLFSMLILVSLPMISRADSCADIKEKYWSCVRDSMANKPCSGNVSIPPECLNAGSESGSSSSQSYSDPSPRPFSSLFHRKKKEQATSNYQSERTPKKLVQIINIRPKDKTYFETEEEVEQYTTEIKDKLFKAFKDGKRVRLEFQ